MKDIPALFRNSHANDLPFLLSQAKEKHNSHFSGLDIAQYFSMLTFCEGRRVFNEDDFIQLALMVYGWMPTMNKNSDLSGLQMAIDSVNRIRAGEVLTNDHGTFEILRSCVNSSYVGLSKFLHVLKPDYYPIWDSRIARAINCPAYDISRNEKKYACYIDWLHNVIHDQDLSNIRKFSRDRHGGKHITDIRALEYCLYIAGAK